MKILSHPLIQRIVFPVIIGIAVAYASHIILKHLEDDSITVSEIERLVPFRIGIAQFWFDQSNRAFGSLVSSLRTDGIEITELASIPDRKIAQGLRYSTYDTMDELKAVPNPAQSPCLPLALGNVEVRELKVWRELINKLELEILVLGELTSEPSQLRLWIGGALGPRSVVLPFSSKLEITRATDRVKTAILRALTQVAQNQLHLDENDELHILKVQRALRSIEQALTWKGLYGSSRLAMKVARARLHENLLIHSQNIATRDVEESYWALKQSNEAAEACASTSVAYEFSEANLATVLTRRTESSVWDERAVATLQRIKETASREGQAELVAISEMFTNRLQIERGMRLDDFTTIQRGLEKLEAQYEQLPHISSPMLWMKLPDTMIVLYRQAAEATGDQSYRDRAVQVEECFPNLPRGAFEAYIKGENSSQTHTCFKSHREDAN